MLHTHHWSQGNEQQVLDDLFTALQVTAGVALEIGGGHDGAKLSNTHFLRDNGWEVIQVDGAAQVAGVHCRFVTVENLVDTLEELKVPRDLDLISWDTDGNDYWFIRALMDGGYRPKAWLTEVNINYPQDVAMSIPYDPDHQYNDSDFHGCTSAALAQLLLPGYRLAGYTSSHINLLWVAAGLPHVHLAGVTPGYPVRARVHRMDPLGRELQPVPPR